MTTPELRSVRDPFQSTSPTLTFSRAAFLWSQPKRVGLGKREQHLHAVLDATAGLYGDQQGIAGKSMIEIEALDVTLLDYQDDQTAD